MLLSYIFTLSIADPLRKLVSAMDEVQKGNLSVSINDRCSDEIGEVTRNFNAMLHEIKNLMENVRIQENRKEKLR